MPFYNLLHTFVRFILSKKYKSFDSKDDLIPAHLLGSTSWESFFHDEIEPLVFGNEFKLEKALTDKNFSAVDLVKRSEDFYSSMGLPPMSNDFWEKSYISNSDGGNGTNCHGTAANMFDKNDFRF
jgi:peptidyl-dipeptidase A